MITLILHLVGEPKADDIRADDVQSDVDLAEAVEKEERWWEVQQRIAVASIRITNWDIMPKAGLCRMAGVGG
jgi:hypothetical protein